MCMPHGHLPVRQLQTCPLAPSGNSDHDSGADWQDPQYLPPQRADHFKAWPQIRGDVVSLQLNQKVSNFVPTRTGVNSSPRLMTRNLTTTFDAKPGDVYVIGGLKTQSGCPMAKT